MSYHLRQRGLEHVILERARVAERWRTERWDSLMFQFPNWSIELPGRRYVGSNPDGFSPKEEILKFIDGYATEIKAPLRTGVEVLCLRRAAKADRYRLVTDQGDFEARNVVVATGPYQQPQIPPCSSGFPRDVMQLHASGYRNPGQLPAGAVLVVGSGASGCQIAEELAESGRRVFFSVGRHHRIPRRYRGRDAFWWRRTLGHLDQIADEAPNAPLVLPPLVTGVRGGHDIVLRDYAANGMTLLGRIRDVCDGRIALGSDLEDNLRLGDQAFEAFTQSVDDYIRKSGFEAPVEPSRPARNSAPPTSASLREVAIHDTGIRAVIWATGYALNFGWIELPVFDGDRKPVHRRGVTESPNIYLLGLTWLHKRKSSFLYGVGEDAEYLADRILHSIG
jgi:putative flavoprotein involved in K+ transport